MSEVKSKAQVLLEKLAPFVEKAIDKAANHFIDTFKRLGDGNKAMKGALNVAVSGGMDADDAFKELASMKKVQDAAKDSPWDEKEIKRFISVKFS